MKLGILLNTNNYPQVLVGLARSGVSRGHDITIFALDDGVKLLENKDCVLLAELEGVHMSYCEHSVQLLKVQTEGVPQEIVSSSQYNNAAMNNQADKVIIL